MIEIVEDTNILIDLFNSGLIRFCHQMGMEFHTTGYVYGEIKDSEQKRLMSGLIMNGLLIIDSFNGDDFVKLTETIAESKGENNLSEADWSVLLLAERLHCRLLTADQKLIRQAHQRGVEANGFLWLCRQMVEMSIISPMQMSDCLQKYKDMNPRAKEPETSEMIDKYRVKA